MSMVIRINEYKNRYEVGFCLHSGLFEVFDSFDLTIEGKLAAINLCSKLNGGQ